MFKQRWYHKATIKLNKLTYTSGYSTNCLTPVIYPPTDRIVADTTSIKFIILQRKKKYIVYITLFNCSLKETFMIEYRYSPLEIKSNCHIEKKVIDNKQLVNY